MKSFSLSSLLLATAAPLLTSSTPLHPRHLSAWPAPIREFYCAVSDRISRIAQTPSSTRPSTPTSSSASAPACSVASATLPSSSLPPPSAGLLPYHIAVGRGTQNYSCPANSDPATAPKALGATAILFNTSCLAAINPTILALVPPAALSVPTPPLNSKTLFPAEAYLSGHHYFSDSTTPVFNLHTKANNFGISFMKKVANVTAPVPEAGKTNVGPDGSKAVAWLKLQVNTPNGNCDPADDKGVQEVYRVNTQGGSAPKTCGDYGKTGEFTVEYSAEYWFFAPSGGASY